MAAESNARQSDEPLKLLFVSAEVAPFAKTGGLADVVGALPRALADMGHTCTVIMPLYNCCKRTRQTIEPTPYRFSVALGSNRVEAGLWKSRLPDSDVPVYFVEQPGYFERDDPGRDSGIYQYRGPDGHMTDYADNGERYIFFCRAVIESIGVLDLRPDVVHANDWHTGLIPAYLREMPVPFVRSLYTIHNVAYQGNFDKHLLPLTGFGWDMFTAEKLEFHDQLSFMKAGIVFADAVTTVSPRYAQEIQTPDFAYGMDPVIRLHRDKLTGIVNGVDYREWNPADDHRIPTHYDIDSLLEGKAANKAELQRRLKLLPVPSTPLVGMITRLAEQKGLDILQASATDLMRENIQFVVLGTGEARYHEFLSWLGRHYRNQASVVLDFNPDLSHLIEAGADMFLMPSRFEPCGLNQLYSLRYGTVPVVRETGGLVDTVTNTTAATLADRTATGFRFQHYNPEALLWAVRRALRYYHARPGDWHQLQRTGMAQDWSWEHSAREYEGLYRGIVAKDEE